MTHRKLFFIALIGMLSIPLGRIVSLRKSTALFDLEQAQTKENLIPVAIIGSGPAGLSAAIFTSRAKIKTIVFAGHEPGGQLNLVKQIENWPTKKKCTGHDLMQDLENQAKQFGSEIIYQTIKEVDFTTWPYTLTSKEGTVVHALSVIIATGGIAKKLDVPGVDTYWGKGIGSCAICEAPFNKDQDVVVVGGSDPASDIALQLAAYAKKVTMVTRGQTLSACATVQDYLHAAKNIEVLTSTSLEEIKGDGQVITSVELLDEKTNTRITLPAKALYFGIGYKPISNIFKPFVETNDEGYIMLQGRSQRTSLPGVFAAGTVEDKDYGKAAVASGNGVKAALDAIGFLETVGLTPYTAKKMEAQFYVPAERRTSDVRLIKNEFELSSLKQKSKVPVVIDLYASYCPSCSHIMQEVEVLAAHAGEKLAFAKIDVGNSPDLAKKLSATSIPALIVFNDNIEVGRFVHITTKEQLHAVLQPWLETSSDNTPSTIQEDSLISKDV